MALADTAALVASLELKDKFSGPAADAGRSLDRLTSKTSTLGRVAGETQRGLGTLAGNLGRIGAIAAGAAVTGLVFSIRAASDLEESLSKVRVVFGESAGAIEAWAATAATSLGESKQQALEAAGTFGNLFQAFGIGRPAAADMSQSLVELAADLASFNNTSIDDALEALRSGVSGEMEPLRRFGVSLTDVRLREKALALGLIRSTKDALTPAVKAQAAYAIILQDTTLAQGDFARTSGGLANQQRILKATLTNTAAVIGTALLPKITELVTQAGKFISDHQGDIQALADQLPAVFDSIMDIAGNLPWSAIGDAFTLMGTGSKALLDAFVGLPPWVQTAVLTGWGLNKLTGGALGSIVGTLASGLIKGVLGITAGVVNITAGTVVGGPGGGGPGGGPVPIVGRGGGLLRGLLGPAGLGLAVAEVSGNRTEMTPEIMAQAIAQALRERKPVSEATAGMTREAIMQLLNMPALQRGISPEVIAQLRDLVGEADRRPNIPDRSRSERIREAEQTQQQIQNLRNVTLTNGQRLMEISGAARQQIQQGIERRAEAAALLQAQAQSLMSLQTIAGKNFSPTVNVKVTSSVSISEVQRRITSQQIAIGHGFQEGF